MADTASLIARVKTEGVAAADKQLDDFSAAAAEAEGAASAYARAQAKAASEAKKSSEPVITAGFPVASAVTVIARMAAA